MNLPHTLFTMSSLWPDKYVRSTLGGGANGETSQASSAAVLGCCPPCMVVVVVQAQPRWAWVLIKYLAITQLFPWLSMAEVQ